MDFKVASFVDHVAFYVSDVHWHISFFNEVLGLAIREIQGDAENPRQVFFHGGIQLCNDPEFKGPEGRMAHIGFMVEDMDAVLEKAYARGVTEMPQGHNWIRLPDGLCLEILQAKAGAVDDYCKVQPR